MSQNRKNKSLEEILRKKFDSVELDGERPSFDKVLHSFQKLEEQSAAGYNFRIWLSVAASFLLLVFLSYLFLMPDVKQQVVAVNTLKEQPVKQNEISSEDNVQEDPFTPLDPSEENDRKLIPVPQSIEQISFISAERNYRYRLPDNSVVFLDEGASVKYGADFGTKNRSLQFTGTGYFEIEKSDVPFVIMTDRSMTVVKGTSFNLRSDELADEIIVTSGQVVFTNVNNNEQQLVLVKGNAARVKNKELRLAEDHNPNDLAWHTGVFQYKTTPIEKMLPELSAFYGKHISVENSSIAGCTFSGTFRNLELSKIMHVIAASLNGQWKEEEGKIILTATGCN